MTTPAAYASFEIVAFIMTIFVMLGCVIYTVTMEGKLPASQIWKALGIFCVLLFLVWATAGYLNEEAFVESGLRPFGLVLRLLPLLLKAL